MTDNAINDGLTGVLTHPAVEQIARQNIYLMRRLKQQCAVILLGIDRFKMVDQRFGTGAGDECLREVAKLLISQFRESDAVGLWSDDEFLVFMPGCARSGAEAKSLQLIDGLRNLQIDFKGNLIRPSANIGAWAGSPRMELETIVLEAEFSLVRSKDMGRNQIFFTPGGVQTTRQRAQLPADRNSRPGASLREYA